MTTRVLVTGGAGYIGSHACKLLASQGLEPVCFDSLILGHKGAVRWGPLVEGDVRNAGAIRSVLHEYRIDAILHFAALAYVGESVSQPDRYYDVNVGGTLAVLQAMREASVRRIVFSSSCATYGAPQQMPIDETVEQHPINPYGRTKLIGEQMISDHAKAFGFDYAVLRYFNAAGCDPDGDLVEQHVPETHLVPRALMAAGGFGPALVIHGTDYGTPDGTAIRDYVHVTDLAVAHGLALAKLRAGAESFAVNLGTGRGYSVREVIGMVEHVTGRSVPMEPGPRRPGDPPMLLAAPRLATDILGFKPRFSDLETIVRTAWQGILTVQGMSTRQFAQ